MVGIRRASRGVRGALWAAVGTRWRYCWPNRLRGPDRHTSPVKWNTCATWRGIACVAAVVEFQDPTFLGQRPVRVEVTLRYPLQSVVSVL